MSITKIITRELTSRASEIRINKYDPENPTIQFKYMNEEGKIGAKTFLVSDLIEQGKVTEENVQIVESILEALANEFNPYKEESE